MLEVVTLHVYQIIVNDTYPSKVFFDEFLSKLKDGSGSNSLKAENGETIAFINREYISDERFFYMNFGLGTDSDYQKTVIDTEHGNVERENPKKKTQIEPVENVYIFYSYLNCELIISSRSKSNFEVLLKHYLSSKKIVLKRLIHDFETFISGLKELSEIRITVKENSLFSSSNNYSEFVNDLYGLDAEQFEIKALFKNRKFLAKEKKIIKELKRRIDNHDFKSLVIVGSDSEETERRFSTDKFYTTIKVEVNKNDESKVNSQKVLQSIRKRYNI